MTSYRYGQLNPYDLHKRLINEYVLKRSGDTALLLAGGRDASRDKTDADVLRENHRFLWDDEELVSGGSGTWEQQLARKYYDKLFKEYCICDLSRFRENKVALRWRTEREVIDGRGQFSCGHKACTSRDALRSWEVNFAYTEHGERHNALVKVRLCIDCSAMLNYRSRKREVKKLRKAARKSTKKSRGTVRDKSHSGADSSASATADRGDLEASTDAESVSMGDEDESSNAAKSSEPAAEGQCWSKATTVEEKSREEEFDDYLEDLLL